MGSAAGVPKGGSEDGENDAEDDCDGGWHGVIVVWILFTFGKFAADKFVPGVGLDFLAVDCGGLDCKDVHVFVTFGKHEPAAEGTFGAGATAGNYGDGFLPRHSGGGPVARVGGGGAVARVCGGGPVTRVGFLFVFPVDFAKDEFHPGFNQAFEADFGDDAEAGGAGFSLLGVVERAALFY